MASLFSHHRIAVEGLRLAALRSLSTQHQVIEIRAIAPKEAARVNFRDPVVTVISIEPSTPIGPTGGLAVGFSHFATLLLSDSASLRLHRRIRLLPVEAVTITLCNGKGGSGKTTLTILLGYALAQAGHDVAILDRDPQKTATRWIEETGGLNIFRPGRSYGSILIDTPPRLDSSEFLDAVRRADVIGLVSSPSPADLFTSRATVGVLEELGLKQRARLIFNQVQPGTILARDLDEFAERIGLPALKNRLQRRQSYQHAVLMGWASLNSDACEEILKIALEITALAEYECRTVAK